MASREGVARTLDERLEEHDGCRKAVQESLRAACDKLGTRIDDAENAISKELEEKFADENNRLQTALGDLRTATASNKDVSAAVSRAEAALLVAQSYEIAGQGICLELNVKHRKVDDAAACASPGSVVDALCERVESLDESRRAAVGSLAERCDDLRKQVCALEGKVNKELMERFTSEDNRLQSMLAALRGAGEEGEDTALSVKKAKTSLIVRQTYELRERGGADIAGMYELVTRREVLTEMLEMRTPEGLKVSRVVGEQIFLEFSSLTDDEEDVLAKSGLGDVVYKVLVTKNNKDPAEYGLAKHGKNSFSFAVEIFEASAAYSFRVQAVFGEKAGGWSAAVKHAIPDLGEYYVWKECPDGGKKYIVSKENPKIATKASDGAFCTIAGAVSLACGTTTAWGIKVLESSKNDGEYIFVGVAPFDIDLDGFNLYRCGWYFDCYSSSLCSGPPHRYRSKEYGPRKEKNGQYVHTGDSVGVVMDMSKGELSFVLNNVNLGVAYEGIPLDKPLVPCVILRELNDSIEFIK